jgi:hypothetical protein
MNSGDNAVTTANLPSVENIAKNGIESTARKRFAASPSPFPIRADFGANSIMLKLEP